MKYLNSNNKEEPNNSNTQLKGRESNIKGINKFIGFCLKNYSRSLYCEHHRRVRRRAFPVALPLLVLVLCMCFLPNLALAEDSTVPKDLLLTGEDVEKVRPDIGVVVYATVLQMRHSQMDTYPVVFSLRAQQELQTDTFQYLGFGKPLYSVTHFVQKSDKDNLYNLGVIMYFTDATFRRSTVFCEFDYSIEGEQILVKQVDVKQLVPDIPQTLFAIVPADRVIDDLLQTYPTNVDILNWIVVNSLKFGEVPEIPSKQPYYIFAATFDRISKGAKLQIRLSDDQSGLEGEAGNCIDLDYDGWHVAIIRGEFGLKTNQEIFIKVIYTPGDDAELKSREPVLIGVYSSDLQQVQSSPSMVESPSGNIKGDISFVTSKSNKLPIVNFEIGTVSGGAFVAPVWLKFYPSGTYDPDGKIVLFEMDMDGDGTFDVLQNTLSGGSFEFTTPGEYTTTVRVTDDKGGITTESKSFTINDPNVVYVEPIKVYKQVEERKSTDVELDKKLDSIIEEYKFQDEELTTTTKETERVYQEPIQKKKKTSKEKTDTSRIFGSNLLVNGSFEKGPSVGYFKLLSKGDEISGWTVTRATVDLVGKYFKSADGNNSIDLNGTSYGEIQQQFSTKKEKQYKLSFYLAGNPGGGPTIKKLLVTVGNKSEEYQFDITGKNVKEMDWEYHELIFTAKGKSTILTFESNHKSGPAAAGPVIDNVKVIEIETEEFVEETLTPKVIIIDDSTIQSTTDSYVYAYSYRNWNEANFGQSELLSVGWHSTGGEKRVYLKFDLSNISADDLLNAQLKLFVNNTVGKNKLIMGVYNVLESWEEGFGTLHSGQPEAIDSSGAITWDYQPAFNDSVFAEFKLRKKRDKSIEVDITALVKSWLTNNSNYGLLLKPQGYLSGRVPTSIYEFYSREYEDETKVPVLELQFKE